MDETPLWLCPNNLMDWMLIFKDQPKQIKDGSERKHENIGNSLDREACFLNVPKLMGEQGHIEVNNSDINATMGNMPDNMKQLKFHQITTNDNCRWSIGVTY